MKLKDRCRDISIGCPIDVDHIRGHVRIELKDEKTGKVEIHEEHNMMTYALKEYFKNCGFMNRPTVQESNNMVEDLLGGVLGLDTELTQTSDMIHIPAGVKMTFNGSVLNSADSGTNTELGIFKSTESGWNEAHTEWTQQYEFGTNQGNGTIATVCLTGKNYGYVGEGNWTSKVRNANPQSAVNLVGSATTYSGIPGYVFNINLTDSSCYSFNIEGESGSEVGKLRKYRLPISKVNIMGTQTAPVLLEEDDVTVDADLISASKLSQSLGNNLVLWNIHAIPGSAPAEWGNGWTQYVWTLTPAGVLTKTTLYNTSGATLHGIQAAIFDGNYIFFCDAYGGGAGSGNNTFIDSTKVYVLNRTTGAITTINNPNGYTVNGGGWYAQSTWLDHIVTVGFLLQHGSGDGRIVTAGNYPFVCDAVLAECAPTNASGSNYGNLSPVSGLIRHNGLTLYRDQGYIASIFNLDSAVTKTADKSMVVRYTVSFVQEEES